MYECTHFVGFMYDPTFVLLMRRTDISCLRFAHCVQASEKPACWAKGCLEINYNLDKVRPQYWSDVPGSLSCRIRLTLSDLDLDAQNSYLFTYNTFIKIIYMLRALPCSSSGGLLRNCIYAASGIVTLCRWLSCAPVKKEPVHKTVTCREWRYQRLHIYN